LGARVVGYSLDPPSVPSLFESSGLSGYLHNIRGDIRDTQKLVTVIRETRPAFLFHLAAAPLLLNSYENPIETFDVNVMGTLSVLESVRRSGCGCSIVVVSTDKCYENQEWEYGYRENDPLGGRDPYSASKAAMEIAVASFRRSFLGPSSTSCAPIRLASARAGNVIGGGDWAANRIVPDAVRALHSKKPLAVRSPEAVRPWQHVLEPLSGYLALGSALSRDTDNEFATAWNFGPDTSKVYAVADLVEAMIQAWGAGSWIVNPSRNGHHEAKMLRLSIDKASSHLRWFPVWNFDETITRTVEWYLNYLAAPYNQPKAYDLCVADILAYESAASEKGIVWAKESTGAAVGY
jgi:CDP-glucose 4,6-dehydratase